MLQLNSVYAQENGFSSYEGSKQQKLRIASTSHIHYVDIRDIVRIQSISNYSKLFFANGKSMLVCKVLAYFDDRLAGLNFVRIHRTHLVNLNFIKQYEHGVMPSIGLNNEEILPVSRRKKKMVQKALTLCN